MQAIAVRILGPLEVVSGSGTPLPISGERQRALLAALALGAGTVVSVSELMAAIWGDGGDHEHRLQQQVSTLRKVLEPNRTRDAEPTVLVTSPPGYVLRDAEVDEHAFSLEADRGLGLAREQRWEEALSALDTARSRWRGPALADVRVTSWMEAQATRLEERRLSVEEVRVDALLALARGADALAELDRLVRDQPYRERFRGQLMLALYRAHRQADALAVFRDTRALLVDELGVEPSPELRELEQSILRQDPGLQLGGASPAAGDLMATARPDQATRAYIRRPDGQIITLADGSSIVGRDPQALVQLADSRVSRRHARIDRVDDGYHVVDLGSTNGTTVNGEPATGQQLADGDVIGLGRVEVIFRYGRLDQA